MKNKIAALLIFLFLNTNIVMGAKMENSYFTWDDFVENFGSQMVSAEDVFLNMSKGGLKNNSILKFDFHFISNNRKNEKGTEGLKNEQYKQ